MYVNMVVGLIHSRGVNSVMAIEEDFPLEGISNLMQRGNYYDVIH